ncbi:MAG: hypothetical protein RL754_1107 [Bacteroidota bacterium]|jgi:glutamate racemase
MSEVKKIGLFDSGLGGLTVLRALERALPDVPKVYYGDTLHLPYGDKSDEAIVRYSKRIVEFLVAQGCELIVIACNSASAAAGKELERAFPQVAFINVIDPVVSEVARGAEQRVGLLGTRATVRSGAYADRLLKLAPEKELCSLSTPLLVPLIEDGFLGTGIDAQVLNHYLKDERLDGIEALVPGCTHYPLLEKVAEEMLDGVRWIDAPAIVAQAVVEAWDYPEAVGLTRYCLSDKTDSFLAMAAQIFGIHADWERVRFPD